MRRNEPQDWQQEEAEGENVSTRRALVYRALGLSAAALENERLKIGDFVRLAELSQLMNAGQGSRIEVGWIGI